MLKLTITGTEFYDEETEKFSSLPDVTLELEHSLISVSKWEAKFQKPFLAPGQKTTPEVIEYIKMMIMSPDHPSDIWGRFTQENLTLINEYIESPQSATTFAEQSSSSPQRETITSELIYYWMVAYKIPFECQYWHLNRLFALVRICGVKNSKPKKMSAAEMNRQRRDLNAQRKAQLGTRG